MSHTLNLASSASGAATNRNPNSVVEVGLNIKKASPYEHTLVAAYSNGYMHYGPPADAYSRGGYEVTECLLASEWQEIYEKKADEIIRKL